MFFQLPVEASSLGQFSLENVITYISEYLGEAGK